MRLFIVLMAFICCFSQAKERPELKIVGPEDAKIIQDVINNISIAYHNLGINIEVVYLPAQRAIAEAKKNTWVDAELFRIESATNVLPQYIKVPTKLFEMDVIAYSNNRSIVLNGWNSLKNYRVASMRGLIHVKQRIEEFDLVDIQFVTTAEQLVNLLLLGRVDLVVLPRIMGNKYLPVDSIGKFHEIPLETVALYHFLHKRHQRLVMPLAAELSALLVEN